MKYGGTKSFTYAAMAIRKAIKACEHYYAEPQDIRGDSERKELRKGIDALVQLHNRLLKIREFRKDVNSGRTKRSYFNEKEYDKTLADFPIHGLL
jgi:hypothetical protein